MLKDNYDLALAECFAPEATAAQRQRAAEIRQATADLRDKARLRHRVEHLRDRLRANCLKSDKRGARKVSKNDFQAQYNAAKQRATSDEYKQIRKEHPAIERKLIELVRRHE